MSSNLLSHRARTAESSAIRDLLRHAKQPHVLSLAGGLPTEELFPVEEIQAASARVLARGEGLQYGLTEGSLALREWIVESRRAIDPDLLPEGIVVTTGSQQALDLIARVVIDPGDVVAVGDPCYVGARQVLASAQADLVGVSADRDGLDTAALQERLEGGLRPKLVYVVANFDNPSGVVLAAERRAHLAALADQYDFLIVEDDPYGELRFEGHPVGEVGPGSSRVVRLRTASKTLAPGFRVGWMIGPSWLIDPVIIAKQAVDLHTSTVAQAIVAELVTTAGFHANHMERLRPWYRNQRDALVAAVRTHLPTAEFEPPTGGMFLWLRLPGADGHELLPRAIDAGVAFVPGQAFAIERDLRDHIRLSYATVAAGDLDAAVARLGQLVRGD